MISGNSTINNSTGAAITTSVAKGVNLNADLTFTGTQALNLNGGTIALGGAAGTRTLNVAASTLSANNVTAAAGVALSKTGAGSLTLTSTTNNVTSLASVLDIQAGKVIAFSDVTVAGLTGSGTYELGGTSRWLFINGSGTQSFGGTIQNGAAALGVTKDGTGSQTLTGNLTLHGVTKPIVLDVTNVTAPTKDPWGNLRIGAQATTKINRQDFGISFNKSLDGGGVLVGNEIAITIDVEVMKKGDAPAS